MGSDILDIWPIICNKVYESICYMTRYWVGGTVDEENSKLVWEDGSSSVFYQIPKESGSNWGAGQPNVS